MKKKLILDKIYGCVKDKLDDILIDKIFNN